MSIHSNEGSKYTKNSQSMNSSEFQLLEPGDWTP